MTERYPVLAAFLRGYLHEDLLAEQGSPGAALEAFLAEARPGERRRLAVDSRRLLARTRGWPVARLRTLLADELRCAWSPGRARDFERLLRRAGRAGTA